MSNIINEEMDKNFVCEYCNNTLSTKHRLNEHIKACSVKKFIEDDKEMLLYYRTKNYHKKYIDLIINEAIESLDKQTLETLRDNKNIDESHFYDHVIKAVNEQNINIIRFYEKIFDLQSTFVRLYFAERNIKEECIPFLKKLIKDIPNSYEHTTIKDDLKTVFNYKDRLYLDDEEKASVIEFKTDIKIKEIYYTDNKIHPYIFVYDSDGNCIERQYYSYNRLTRRIDYSKQERILYNYYEEGKIEDSTSKDEPSIIKYHDKECLIVKEQHYYKNNVLHSVGHPSIIEYDIDNNIIREEYYTDGKPSYLYRVVNDDISYNINDLTYTINYHELSTLEGIRDVNDTIGKYEALRYYLFEDNKFSEHEINKYKIQHALEGDAKDHFDILNNAGIQVYKHAIYYDHIIKRTTIGLKRTYNRVMYIPSYGKIVDCLITEYFYVKDYDKVLHRWFDDGPALIIQDANTEKDITRMYFVDGKLYNGNNYSWIEYDENMNEKLIITSIVPGDIHVGKNSDYIDCYEEQVIDYFTFGNYHQYNNDDCTDFSKHDSHITCKFVKDKNICFSTSSVTNIDDISYRNVKQSNDSKLTEAEIILMTENQQKIVLKNILAWPSNNYLQFYYLNRVNPDIIDLKNCIPELNWDKLQENEVQLYIELFTKELKKTHKTWYKIYSRIVKHKLQDKCKTLIDFLQSKKLI